MSSCEQGEATRLHLTPVGRFSNHANMLIADRAHGSGPHESIALQESCTFSLTPARTFDILRRPYWEHADHELIERGRYLSGQDSRETPR